MSLGELELNILCIYMLFGDQIAHTDHILFSPSQDSDLSHPCKLIPQLINESFEY